MEDYSYDREMQPEKRNTFLTVLCVLTFIGSGWAIISSVVSYKFVDKRIALYSDSTKINSDRDTLTTVGSVVVTKSMDANNVDSTIDEDSSIDEIIMVDSANNKVEETPIEKKMKNSFKEIITRENIERRAIGDFIAALFTLLGAILMWKLKRNGFYIYIVGVIINIATPFYLYGNDFVAVGLSMFSGFFGLVFIALYALNFKSLKK